METHRAIWHKGCLRILVPIPTPSVIREEPDRFPILCEQIWEAQDNNKLIELVQELNTLLERRRGPLSSTEAN
jgi:hypothetical protein